MLDEALKKEIVSKIAQNLKYIKIILFGSYAKNFNNEESDIDLIVVLDETGISKSFKERMDKKFKVGRLFVDLKQRIPMDILVYTKDEWDKINQINSSFIQEINETGVIIG